MHKSLRISFKLGPVELNSKLKLLNYKTLFTNSCLCDVAMQSHGIMSALAPSIPY